MSPRLTFATAALALVSSVSAHLAMNHPIPIPGSNPKDPLDASGSNFPCHGVALPGSGGQSMPAGSTQKLSFDLGGGFNTAVHGGGSCQLSVTYETDSEKIKDPANWRVIKSIEGGCPTNTALNLDLTYQGPNGAYTEARSCDDPTTNGVDCVNSFDFEIPKDLPSGQATIAWTWFNTIGNREMYMNCAAANIVGGSSDTSFFNSLPQMFVANMASVNSCPTTEQVAVKFPNPGTALEIKTASPNMKLATPLSPYPIGLPTGAGCADGGAGSAPAPPSVPSPTPPPAPSNPGGVFGPGASRSTSFTTSVTTTTAPSPPAVSPPAPPPAPPVPDSQGVPCPEDGAVVCMESSMFGLCNHGYAVAQPLAAGMRCSNGQIMKRDFHPHGFHHRRGKRSF